MEEIMTGAKPLKFIYLFIYELFNSKYDLEKKKNRG